MGLRPQRSDAIPTNGVTRMTTTAATPLVTLDALRAAAAVLRGHPDAQALDVLLDDVGDQAEQPMLIVHQAGPGVPGELGGLERRGGADLGAGRCGVEIDEEGAAPQLEGQKQLPGSVK